MKLREAKGNMYSFLTHTFNGGIKGRCPHDCSYCYMKRWRQGEARLDRGELQGDLPEGKFIFVGSSIDIFAEGIPLEWIAATLVYCLRFDNRYLFQSKNPGRMGIVFSTWPRWSGEEDKKSSIVLGTTIETNRSYPGIMGTAPSPQERARELYWLSVEKYQTTVTIEPIMDFDLEDLVDLVERCRPAWVNVGADSQGHGLPEPGREKIRALIKRLEDFTDVKPKKNLERLLQER